MKSYSSLTFPSDDAPPMEKTRLSSKGQLVLPKALRDARNWSEGTWFVAEPVADGVLLRPAQPFPATRLEDVIGSAGYRGRPVSLDAMGKAVAKGAEARRGRGRY